MLEFEKGRFVHAIWYVASRDNSGDWMAMVFHDPGEPWRLTYRFRYYKDAKIFGSDDRRSWYGAQAEKGVSVSKLEEAVEAAADAVVLMLGGPKWRVPIESDDPKVVMAQLQKQPWCHMKFEERSS